MPTATPHTAATIGFGKGREGTQELPGRRVQVVGWSGEEVVQIIACAEGVFTAVEQDDGDDRIGSGALQLGSQLLVHRDGQGIFAGGTVEGDGENAVVFVGLDVGHESTRDFLGALVSCLGNKLFTFGGVLSVRPALPLLAIALL